MKQKKQKVNSKWAEYEWMEQENTNTISNLIKGNAQLMVSGIEEYETNDIFEIRNRLNNLW